MCLDEALGHGYGRGGGGGRGKEKKYSFCKILRKYMVTDFMILAMKIYKNTAIRK